MKTEEASLVIARTAMPVTRMAWLVAAGLVALSVLLMVSMYTLLTAQFVLSRMVFAAWMGGAGVLAAGLSAAAGFEVRRAVRRQRVYRARIAAAMNSQPAMGDLDRGEIDAALYEAILAGEHGAVPRSERIGELEAKYKSRIARLWVIGKGAPNAKPPKKRQASTSVRARWRPGGALQVNWVVVGGIVVCAAVFVLATLPLGPQGPLSAGASLNLRIGAFVAAYALYEFGRKRMPRWTMVLHKRGITLECRQWPGDVLLETVEVQFGRDVVWVKLGGASVVSAGNEKDGRAVVGVHLAERTLRLEGEPVELPEGMVWRVLASEQMVSPIT